MDKLKPKMLWPVAMLVLAAALLLFSRPAGATVWTVTSSSDSGADSLRGVVASAVAGDTINFADNIGKIILAAEVPIDKNLTISGPSADKLTLSGNNAVRVFRVTSSATLNLENLKVADGISDMGGGLYVESGSSATLSNCILSNNSATSSGGGLYVESGSSATISNCTFSNNSATYSGGGVVNWGTATLSNCTLSGNSAPYYGGGFSNEDGGTVTLTNCILSGNSATSSGGGLYSNGTATLTNCTLSNNSATDNGGGLYNQAAGTMVLTNCTLSGNSAHYGGGGLENWGTATLTNCTLYNNSALNYGGGLYNYVNATLTNCTVASNSAPDGGGLYYAMSSVPVVVKNNIIANNSGGNCSGEGVTAIGDGGYNIDSGTSCGFSSIRSNTDPFLAPLADNGGATQTCALGLGSLAVNAIPVGSNGCGTTITTDQRGEPRPKSNWCDIGAFETLPNTTTTVTTSLNPSVYGQSTIVMATVNGNSPSGTVAFRLDGGTISGCDAVPLSSGQASCPASGLAVGAHSVSATYSGDASNHSSIGSLAHQVNKAESITAIITHAPALSVVGENVAVGFSVTAKAPGAGTPTGSVTITNAISSCTATVAAGSCSLPFDYFGVATLAATYAGDTNFTASQSAGVSHTVNLGAAAVTLSPVALDAGSLAVGATGAAQHVTLINTDSSPLGITSIPVSAGDFAVTHNCPATLNVGASCAINVTFHPTAAGVRTATLEIVDSAGTRSVPLAGTGTIAAGSIVIDPADAGTLYAGLDGAGVFRSSNGGASWTAATTQPGDKRIKALVISKTDSSRLFAASYGNGVYTSTDGGDTWLACANTNLTNLNLVSLIIDSSGKLYAGSEAGVFMSSDNCAIWTVINTGLPM